MKFWICCWLEWSKSNSGCFRMVNQILSSVISNKLKKKKNYHETRRRKIYIQSPIDSTQFLQINHKNQHDAILPRMQLYIKINPKLIKD